MKYTMTTPCDNCPFRSDATGIRLSPARIHEIQHGLDRGTFPCHKTTTASGASGENEVHCAGALILLEKIQRPSQMMRIAERLGMYDMHQLDMAAPVFDSFAAMLRANRPLRKLHYTKG